MCSNSLIPVNELSFKDRKQLDKLWLMLEPRILSGELDGRKLHNASVKWMHERMMKKAYAAFEQDFNTLTPGSPAFKKLAKIELDSYVFASLKSNKFLKEAELLRSEHKGKALQKELNLLHQKYYHFYAEAEINNVNNVSLAAAKWAEIENEQNQGSPFVYLQYNSMRDERVREEHLAMDDIKLRSDHPFWKTYFPPNGYNCRCYVTEDFEGPETGGISMPSLAKESKVHPMFQKNFGITAKPFSGKKAHPYFNTEAFNEKNLRDLNVQIAKGLDSLKGYYTYPNTSVQIHGAAIIEENTIMQAEMLILSEQFKNIKILPEVNINSFKTPDFVNNKKLVELKHMEADQSKTEKFIMRRVGEAGAQNANAVYLLFPSNNLNTEQIIKAISRIEGQPFNFKSVQEINIQIPGHKPYKIKREDINLNDLTQWLKTTEATQ